MLMTLEKPFKVKLRALPPDDQKTVLDAVTDPHNPRHRLKKVKSRRLRKESWSIRILNHKYRAFAQKAGCLYRWYWVGTHEQANGFL